ncbi:MAG: hypothetical protein JSR44_16015, partial [Spirochaetes bacterium]|nr:hypothetical protein [Spirochaetota bacterium]
MKNNTYAVASIFLLSLPLSANPISWGEKSTNLNLTEHLEYYIDSDNNATLAAIEKVDDKNFRPAAGANLGFSAKPIWLRFRFAQNGEKILLRHDYAMTDYLTLYSPTTQGYIATDTGDMRPFASRAVKNRLMSFWVTPVKERWYYMRLQTGGSVNFAFTLLTPTEALESDNISQYFLGIFFGTIFVMFFYNLFLYLSLREASYIFYCLYIVAFAFMAATLNGLAFQLVWPQSPWWQNHAFPFFAGVGMTMGVIFALLFLQLRKLNRILYWVAMAVASVGSIAIVLTFVIDPAISVRLVNGLGVFWVLTILSSAVFAFAKGYKPARYFLLAWLAMLVGTTIFILTSRGLLPPNPFLLNAMFVGSALEVILLSLALADRINQFKKEKERLQQLALDKQKVLTDSYSRFF